MSFWLLQLRIELGLGVGVTFINCINNYVNGGFSQG